MYQSEMIDEECLMSASWGRPLRAREFCSKINNHDIIVSNFKSGERVSFSLLLLRGYVTTKKGSPCSQQPASYLSISNVDDPTFSSQNCVWSSLNSEFKCLLSLRKGTNKFIFKYCSAELHFNVIYRLESAAFCVTPVYIICKGHDGRFQAPEYEDNSIESACERISVGMLLIQSLMAETLFESGYGHKSFFLNHDLKPDVPECQVFYSKLSIHQAWEMSSSALWEYFAREIMTSNLASSSMKYVAFISCTKYLGCSSNQLPSTYEEILALTKAHAALGGGGLALFGSACLYTWPCCIEEVGSRFLCTTKVNKTLFMDDSYYRGTLGACFSTTLGSVCHELGHTFDLGHTKDGIMGSGYHNIHNIFMLHDVKKTEEISKTSKTKQLATISFSKDLLVTFQNPSLGNNQTIKGEAVKLRNLGTTDTHGNKNAIIENTIKITFDKTNMQKEVKQQKLEEPHYQRGLKNTNEDTFWSDSCSAILAHHRWFNPSNHHSSTNKLTYDKERSLVSSPFGIRVVEFRDSPGTVFESWVLSQNVEQDFSLSKTVEIPTGSYIIAMDSVGSILKETLH